MDTITYVRRTLGLTIAFILFFAVSVWNTEVIACTAIYVKTKDRILVGNNEDGGNPETRIWIIPGENGTYGRIYFGFSDLSAQGGINEKGLWFDAFGLPYKTVKAQGEIYAGDLQDKLMAECATVDDVLELLKHYNRSPMTRYQWMFGDSKGNSVIIQGDTVILKHKNYQVVTNFRQSIYPDGKGYDCPRYRLADDFLSSHPENDLNKVRNILSATHSEGQDVTLYSYIADLTNGLIYVYHFHNFENAVVLNVKSEISKGKHVYNLSEMFPETIAAESFEYRSRLELNQLKASRRFKDFDSVTFPEYFGNYIITSPEILANQLITISQGSDCLHLQLNGGGPYELIPESPEAFVMLSYGGMEFACRFKSNMSKFRDELSMDGSGLAIIARRLE